MIRAACSVRSAARDRLTSLRSSCRSARSVSAVAMRTERIAAEIGLEADSEHRRAERREAGGHQREPIAVALTNGATDAEPDERRDRHDQRRGEQRRADLLEPVVEQLDLLGVALGDRRPAARPRDRRSLSPSARRAARDRATPTGSRSPARCRSRTSRSSAAAPDWSRCPAGRARQCRAASGCASAAAARRAGDNRASGDAIRCAMPILALRMIASVITQLDRRELEFQVRRHEGAEAQAHGDAAEQEVEDVAAAVGLREMGREPVGPAIGIARAGRSARRNRGRRRSPAR